MSSLSYSKLSLQDFSTQFNLKDGCAITLSCIVQSSNQTSMITNTNNVPMLSSDQNINTSPNQSFTFPVLSQVYISPRVTEFSPNVPVYTFKDLSTANVQDPGYDSSLWNLTVNTNTSGTKNVTAAVYDDMTVRSAMPNFYNSHVFVQFRQQYDKNAYTPWSTTQDDVTQVITKADPSTSAPNATQRLYMQIARDGTDTYLLLRGDNTSDYLHMLPLQNINSNSNSPKTNLMPAWRSDLKSTAYTAHWIPYSIQNSSSILFQNRAYGLFLCVDTSSVAPITFYQNNFSFASRRNFYPPSRSGNFDQRNNTIYQATTYFDMFAQPVYRMRAVNLTEALGNQNAQFTVTKWTTDDNTADFIKNPIGSAALTQANLTPTANVSGLTMSQRINDFCSVGLNGLTDSCIQWAVSQNALAAGWVPNVCARFPNDRTLCGCQNIQQYYGIINYIQVATGSQQSWLPYCNASACANQSMAWRPPNLNIKCESQTCIQAINAAATNITIKDISFTCAAASTSTSAYNEIKPFNPFIFLFLVIIPLFVLGVYLFRPKNLKHMKAAF